MTIYFTADYTYDDIYNRIFDKVAEFPQMSKEAYYDTLKIFDYAHHGLCRWNLKDRGELPIYNEPMHITNENAVSLLSGLGYGAIVTSDFFENVSSDTVAFGLKIFPLLSDKDSFIVCLAIISMSDISFVELKEKLEFDDDKLRNSLDRLIASELVIEKKSKHRSLGYTYEINSMYHTCLCLMIATLEMQKESLKGISCCMGFGDFPIKL